ncbi:hypothetical protein [Paludifilum halophilum]|uniref:Uncharacterized protein n=1 Tax=Paludifilum halophilum TaxID=1642702 RepID=A0A235B9S9_9BACL|nr:hypothetical protein [Paludifilum halophilum]OYD09021.1 hypothetical protein CHM34_04405 [Paludifilum halophilum]
MKGRSWTEEEDRFLAEQVLQSIREGGNQLDAFERVARKIGRTPGACGFRWNAVVRKKQAEAFNQAKKQRVASHLKKKKATAFSLKNLIRQLRAFDREYRADREAIQRLERQLKKKERQLRGVAEENRRLKEEWEAYHSFQNDIKDRYAHLLKLLQSAGALIRQEEPEANGPTEVEIEVNHPPEEEVRGSSVDTDWETGS